MARAIRESWSFLDKMFEETYFPCGWMPRVSATCDVHLSKASDPTSIGNALDCLLLVVWKIAQQGFHGNEFQPIFKAKWEPTQGPKENSSKLRKPPAPTPGIHHRWQRNGPLNCRSHRKRWTLAAGIPVPPFGNKVTYVLVAVPRSSAMFFCCAWMAWKRGLETWVCL